MKTTEGQYIAAAAGPPEGPKPPDRPAARSQGSHSPWSSPPGSSISQTSYALIRGRPSQRSQESPNWPQPVRLECRSQTTSR